MHNLQSSKQIKKIVNGLIEHHDTLEKLYSLVVTIQYALEKQDYGLFAHLNQAKQVILDELQEHETDLQNWNTFLQKKWIPDALQHELKAKIDKIKRLSAEILEIENRNALQIESIKDLALFSEEERSEKCVLKSQI